MSVDLPYTLRCFEENLRGLAEDYFRATLINPEVFPVEDVASRAIIFVCNHSGMGLSWDNIILDFLIYDRLLAALGDPKHAIENKAVRLVDPLFLSHGAVQPFQLRNWWERTGCVAANSANFETAVKNKRIIIVSPEGVKGIAKGPFKKYQLQPFSSSFLRMAHLAGAWVIPVSVINAEYLNPCNISLSWLNWLGRGLGFPFVPVGTCLFNALLPATYLAPRPAKLTYVLHPRISFVASEVPAYKQLRCDAEAFRGVQQLRLDEERIKHRAPYALGQWFMRLRSSHRWKIFFPIFWHEMFLRTDGAPAWLSLLYKLPLAYPLIWMVNRKRHAKGPRAP